MSYILNVESSTEVCSVAIAKGGDLKGLAETKSRYEHAKMITLLIEACCKDAQISLSDLDAVALSSGPGSYTSLRIGTSAAKAICYAKGIPLIAVDTLQALAWASKELEQDKEALYVPMIDARRKDVYTAIFDANNNPVTKTSFETIVKNSYKSYFASEKTLIFSGNGSEKCRQILEPSKAVFCPILCSAVHMCTLSHQSFLKQEFQDLAYYVPNYHKKPNITSPKKTPLGSIGM